VWKGPKLVAIEAADPRLNDGFHGFEPALGQRWTDGRGVIPTELFDGLEGAMELELQIAATACYAVDGSVVDRAAA
jgi:hypothetical protein